MQGQGWIDSINLQVGMQIEAFAENRHLTVIALVDQQRTETTYNLEVDEFHAYFVGKMGAWVHNQTGCKKCGQPEYVYGHMNEDGVFTYFGITNNPRRRAGEHLNDPQKTGSTMQILTGQLNHDEARTIEGKLIRNRLEEARAQGLITGLEPIEVQLKKQA